MCVDSHVKKTSGLIEDKGRSKHAVLSSCSGQLQTESYFLPFKLSHIFFLNLKIYLVFQIREL